MASGSVRDTTEGGAATVTGVCASGRESPALLWSGSGHHALCTLLTTRLGLVGSVVGDVAAEGIRLVAWRVMRCGMGHECHLRSSEMPGALCGQGKGRGWLGALEILCRIHTSWKDNLWVMI